MFIAAGSPQKKSVLGTIVSGKASDTELMQWWHEEWHVVLVVTMCVSDTAVAV